MLKVNYNYSPQSPFTDLLKNKDYELINQINSSNTKILFVALGCPVQELWMEMYKKDFLLHYSFKTHVENGFHLQFCFIFYKDAKVSS